MEEDAQFQDGEVGEAVIFLRSTYMSVSKQ
jgi:hypothetical protein